MSAFAVLWLLDLQETLLVVSAFFVLSASLLSCHLFFHAKRGVFDRDILRVIDYVYLLIGSFGLMGAFDVQE